ncbi:hypothetical protein [Verrucosispora sp. NA02020]|uniref:hypothetical protein n=1 Tax=Verrucosispora sp. NA02020 TaxID=2742132 RepID=UPI001591D172|nr:hypothetical protein [Verrucosispora sp. NA02020]QKW15004.1 hypothetical protein HUT12_20970 [Verrucosispora sp. NA02020]
MPEPSTRMTVFNRIVRVLLVIGVVGHAALACLQPFLAGWSLDGDGTALLLHGANGGVIISLSMALIPLGVLWWRPGGGTLWAPVLALLLFAAETFQLGMGYADILVIHVPLGVGILLGSLLLCGITLPRSSRATGVRAERKALS